MEGDSIWGSKDFRVPEYFNFADVLDEWAQKEKVTRCCGLKKDLNFSSSLANYEHSFTLEMRLPDTPAKQNNKNIYPGI